MGDTLLTMTTLYRLDSTNQELKPVASATYAELQLKERADIQEWIKKDPGILFPDTGDELMLITSEFDGFDKTRERLDVLALDKSGRLVVVELKRDTSTSSAHLQVIGYAAYLSAFSFTDLVEIYIQYQRSLGRKGEDPMFEAEIIDFIELETKGETWVPNARLVVASGSFRPEVLASCQWLRTYGIDISCVQISPYTLHNDVLVHVSTLIPLPEEDTIRMRRRKVRRSRERNSNRSHRTEEWWRNENTKSSKAFFETLDRFQQWSKKEGLKLEINWTATSYVGFWAGSRCVAPFWPQKSGAAIYLPDNASDGDGDTPSSFFIEHKAELDEVGLNTSWAFKYNAGANPIRMTISAGAFSQPTFLEFLGKTVGKLIESSG